VRSSDAAVKQLATNTRMSKALAAIVAVDDAKSSDAKDKEEQKIKVRTCVRVKLYYLI